MVFYYGVLGTISSFVLLLVFQGLPILPHDPITLLLLGSLSLCGCLGQTTLNKGAQMIDASKTSVLRNADIAFVLVFQIVLLGELPTIWSSIGLLLISSCTILIALTKSSALPSKTQDESIDMTELEDLGEIQDFNVETEGKEHTSK
eukprot:CAMPEP_0206205182 /NCGR_PEP_ID=MMETSP0166-20121206/14040_1 /ASSEMBLY_ACC=CAM_ASM_000260 /TAXON_ID=95228 /ORGANISM="Vannella robusta, Strain DIVA3 518/3/11/1/6" /LENGTH=146 /DNA_ID=CAMNT_0053625097 /DNA_START=609 /DNA_END=1046 /DNA_ORIENTATION=+